MFGLIHNIAWSLQYLTKGAVIFFMLRVTWQIHLFASFKTCIFWDPVRIILVITGLRLKRCQRLGCTNWSCRRILTSSNNSSGVLLPFLAAFLFRQLFFSRKFFSSSLLLLQLEGERFFLICARGPRCDIEVAGWGGISDRIGASTTSVFQSSFTLVIAPLSQTLQDSFFPEVSASEITTRSTSGRASILVHVINK